MNHGVIQNMFTRSHALAWERFLYTRFRSHVQARERLLKIFLFEEIGLKFIARHKCRVTITYFYSST